MLLFEVRQIKHLTLGKNYGIINDTQISEQGITMGDLIKIERNNSTVDAVIKVLNDNNLNIKDIFCALRLNNGQLLVFDADVPFETLCTISKKLDLIIDFRQQEEDEELEEDEVE